MADRVGVLYCGSCGALNPRTNHYCSACGHQLVDAYHPSEGLRIYQTADPGAPLVDIVDPGADITVVETDEVLPADFAKVLLADGRVGYVRLREVERATAGDVGEPGRREPLGCISPTAVLAIIALMIVAATLFLALAFSTDDPTADFIAVLSCITVVPFLFVVVGFYLYVRKRETELLGEDDEDGDAREALPDAGRRAAESGSN